MPARRKQAVVLIHGVGQQQPMDTLRRFVEVLADGDLIRDKPDRLHGSHELRRLVLPRDRDKKRPTTDFYEMYWAHLMPDGKWKAILAWIAQLIVAPSKELTVPARRLRLAIWFAIALTAFATGALAGLVVRGTEDPIVGGIQWISGVSGTAATVVNVAIGYFVLGYVGDAASYLSPRPANVKARAAIRAEGLQLLEKLHESGKYDRVVIVGHSLGSVIGYDLVRLAWDTRRCPSFERFFEQVELEAYAEAEEQLDGTHLKLKAFREAQDRLWQEQRSLGSTWLVTDFVTLGSPLTHARLLLGSKTASFDARVQSGEFPASPPAEPPEEGDEHGTFYKENQEVASTEEGGPGMRCFRLLRHSSPFAVVRWSNLYFPNRWVVLGDPIGGEVAPAFGHGVRDVAVRTADRSLMGRVWRCHIDYWRPGAPHEAGEAVRELRVALRLDAMERADN